MQYGEGAQVEVAAATASGLLRGAYSFTDLDGCKADIKLHPWHALSGVTVTIDGFHGDKGVAPQRAELAFGDDTVSLPVGKRPQRELTADEQRVLAAALNRSADDQDRR